MCGEPQQAFSRAGAGGPAGEEAQAAAAQVRAVGTGKAGRVREL